MRLLISRLNLLFLMGLVISYGFYIIAYGFFNWHSTNAKWVYYIATATAQLYFTAEECAGYRDEFQRQFNIIGKFFIGINCLLFAINLQGMLTNPVLCLCALYGSVIVITIGIVYNLKKYEYI